MRLESSKSTGSTSPSPTVTLVRNGPLNTACRTLIEESSGCEDDQAALQGAENRSCLAQVMRSGTVGLKGRGGICASVIENGTVRVGDEIEVVQPAKERP